MLVVKVSEATGSVLDWMVAKCEGVTEKDMGHWKLPILEACSSCQYSPSTNWAQGGPIVEREEISLDRFGDYPNWESHAPSQTRTVRGPTPLIAAMRAYVASKFGEEAEVPDGLT